MGWPARSSGPPAAIFPVAGLQTFGSTFGFNADAWDSNSGPHASVTGGLLAAPFSALEHGLSKGIPAQRLKKVSRAV